MSFEDDVLIKYNTLKYPDGAPKDWAHQLLDFNDQGAMGQLPESICEDLQQNTFMCNKLCSLVDKIHVSPNPGAFNNPTDLARSFHVQQAAPFYLSNAARILGRRNQEELNAASTTLCALNLNRGLFKQPAACTIGLSTRQQATSVPSTFRTWGQTVHEEPSAAPPPRLPCDDNARSNNTLCYVDPSAPPQSEPASFPLTSAKTRDAMPHPYWHPAALI
ncbi:hypothetical protein C0992_002591 [Termitomyces sp. T32_za158]|nr:hypothetical protein C0992_002591 [Termitomyces sp. T32_za158]